jgi:rod shape-determining protein MreD
MKNFLLYLAFAYLALSVQSIFFTGVRPDFVIVLVCCYSLKYGYAKGAAYGALTGLIIDTMGGFILGPNIISKSLAAFIIMIVRGKIFQWSMFANTIMVALLVIVDILIVYLCYEIFLPGSFATRLWVISPKEIMFTIAFALAAYNLFSLNSDSGLRQDG